MIRRFIRENWLVFVIVAMVGGFMTLATTVIWPPQEPTVINRIGVATYYDGEQTYYCFRLDENQYNDTVFDSEVWGDRMVVFVPVPIQVYMPTVSSGNVTITLDR